MRITSARSRCPSPITKVTRDGPSIAMVERRCAMASRHETASTPGRVVAPQPHRCVKKPGAPLRRPQVAFPSFCGVWFNPAGWPLWGFPSEA